MHRHGRYWRCAVTSRRVYRVPIYRWRCAQCKGTVAVLPDFLAPYEQFVSLVREGVMRRYVHGRSVAEITRRACRAGASELSARTVTRWLAAVRKWAAPWSQVLCTRLLVSRPHYDLFTPGARWEGPCALLKALCDLGDRCRGEVPHKQGHPGLYAYCNGLLVDLPRL